jgi:hypothetical protein
MNVYYRKYAQEMEIYLLSEKLSRWRNRERE